MNNVISIKNVNKKYDEFFLENISFELKEGRVLGILGENGAGKTTTIKALLNLIKVDSGEIKIFDLDNIKYEKDIKSNIGVLLDNSFLPGYYNAKDINKLMKIIYNNWNEKKYFKYIEEFKLPIDKEIKNFSKGMYIKIKIAVVLSFTPKLLILDEPTSGLDPIARSDILDIFNDYVKQYNASI